MAERIVVIGLKDIEQQNVKCLEVKADDASAIVESGICVASLSHYGGELTNATVLRIADAYVQKLSLQLPDHGEVRLHEEAWRRLLALPLRGEREFVIPAPLT